MVAERCRLIFNGLFLFQVVQRRIEQEGRLLVSAVEKFLEKLALFFMFFVCYWFLIYKFSLFRGILFLMSFFPCFKIYIS